MGCEKVSSRARRPLGADEGSIRLLPVAQDKPGWGDDLDALPKTAPQIPRRTLCVLARNDSQVKPLPIDCSYFLGVSREIAGRALSAATVAGSCRCHCLLPPPLPLSLMGVSHAA